MPGTSVEISLRISVFLPGYNFAPILFETAKTLRYAITWQL